MSLLAATVADRVAAHTMAGELAYYGSDWAVEDIRDLLRETWRLSDDYRCRTGIDRSASEWSVIEARIVAAAAAGELHRYGNEHAESDARALVDAVDRMESELLRLPPRMSGR